MTAFSWSSTHAGDYQHCLIVTSEDNDLPLASDDEPEPLNLIADILAREVTWAIRPSNG